MAKYIIELGDKKLEEVREEFRDCMSKIEEDFSAWIKTEKMDWVEDDEAGSISHHFLYAEDPTSPGRIRNAVMPQ